MSRARVLVFDSGVGGLSIAGCIHRRLPSVELVYAADNAGFPYGDQAEQVVIDSSLSLIQQTLELYPSDVVVVACNTASTVALPDLREALDVPVVGVVPAIKPAAEVSRNRRIGLLATPATIRRPYLEDLIRRFAPDCYIERVGHGPLVHWIEELVGGKALPGRELYQALEPLRAADVDTVVLGCTHYPLIAGALRECVPGVRWWVDSGEAIARRTGWLLQQQGLDGVTGEGSARPVRSLYFSGPTPAGLADFMAGMGLGLPSG